MSETAPTRRDIDLFAGPGGWSVACKTLGLAEVGIELDPAACATRTAAGHTTIRADVAALPVAHLSGKVRGLIASPPCQGFSMAGKRSGLSDLDLCHELIDDISAGRDTRQDKSLHARDARSLLVAEPLRWALAARPDWIALEQVPAVLPLWQHTAECLRVAGYSTWTGVLKAADYGVPQTRHRAILIASRVLSAVPPLPTHAETAEPETLFGPGRLPWVSMAEALGCDRTPIVNARGNHVGGGSDFPSSGPAWTLTKSTRSWSLRVCNQSNATVRPIDDPAPTLLFGHRMNDVRFQAGDGTPGDRLSIAEASVLQTFPADYPWSGSNTKTFEQIGNAVPPRLAQALLGVLVPTMVNGPSGAAASRRPPAEIGTLSNDPITTAAAVRRCRIA